jgi:DNA-binding transcriptional MerR regulator
LSETGKAVGQVSSRYLRTSDIARAVGVHPNTVRLYEAWGLLPPIPRAQNGYRMFTATHVDQMRLARLAMRITWLGGTIRKLALSVVHSGAIGDLVASLEQAMSLQDIIRAEIDHAHAAADVLERWAQGSDPLSELDSPRTIGQVAQYLNITPDMLRNWERNGLLSVPRDPVNQYRQYGPTEIDRLRVIRTLRMAGYSVMAILRLMLAFDQGQRVGLRAVLDTPRPDEDVQVATDRWISALAEVEGAAQAMIDHLHTMINNPRR